MPAAAAAGQVKCIGGCGIRTDYRIGDIIGAVVPIVGDTGASIHCRRISSERHGFTLTDGDVIARVGLALRE